MPKRSCESGRGWFVLLSAALLFLSAPCAGAADVLGIVEPPPAEVPQPQAPTVPELRAIEIPDEGQPLRAIDLVTPPEDLWARIRNGFSMPNLSNSLVIQQQAWYLNRPQLLARLVERSRRYLHHIVEEIERRGLPTELALLPMVESAYDPMALSPARASGIWQFIPSTGRNYGLKQNWWVDERRDIVAATSAALDYLQTIYEMHGDWHLALASYNWGEGAVGRAVERNRALGRPTDYSSLSMPNETRNYVPKLQALKNIVSHPDRFNVILEPIPNRPYFTTVEKPANMDLAVAARLAEIPLHELKALNPGYNRPVASGEGGLALPAEKVETFFANLESHDKPLVSWRTYTLKRGEKLADVANHFGLPLTTLREINGIGPRTRVVPGNTLLVPARGAAVLTMHDPGFNPPVDQIAPQRSAKPAKSGSAAAKAPSAKPGKKAQANTKTQPAGASSKAKAGGPPAGQKSAPKPKSRKP